MSSTRKTGSKAAAPKRGAAAKAAGNKPKGIKWQGLDLELPPALPESMLFDIVEVEATDNPLPILRAIRSILGPEQFTEVRYKLEEKGDEAGLESLLADLFGAYGLTLGES